MRGVALFVACAAAMGCSDRDDGRRPSLPSTPPGATGGGGSAGGGGNGEPAAPCELADTGAVEIYPAGAAPALERLASVGDRWLASGPAGYVFFDRDGDNADPVPSVLGASLGAITSEGDTGAVAAAENAIQYQRFAPDGMPLTAPLGVAAQAPVGLTVASNDGETLVVWAYNTRLRARGVNQSGGFSGDAYDLQSGAYATFVFVTAAARGDTFGVAWSSDVAMGTHQTHFIRAGDTEPLGEATRLLETTTPHRVVRLVATAEGYALLLRGEGEDGAVQVMTLAEDGTPTKHVALEDAAAAYDMAAAGDRLAVVTARPSGEPQLRVFGLDLEPAGPWVCLGGDHDPFYPPAVAPDDAGYATLYTSAGGAVLLLRLDEGNLTESAANEE